MPPPDLKKIEKRTASAYNKFLESWVNRKTANFFPHRLHISLKTDENDVPGTIAWNEKLIEKSKEKRGWGYTVHRKQSNSRTRGRNTVPDYLTIDTEADLLQLAGKSKGFERTQFIVNRIREKLPELDNWLIKNIKKLAIIEQNKEGLIEGLIEVSQYFLNHPRPDCYARQLPVSVDTKFIENNKVTLKQWLDILLPSSAIDLNENDFFARFGLREKNPHRALRLLDPRLKKELGLPFDELSLPIQSMAKLQVQNATVVIVENRMNFLTLPSFSRGICILGDGKSVSLLGAVEWLSRNRILYWGDIDTAGFCILAQIRNFFPHVESVMMDRETVAAHQQFHGTCTNKAQTMPTNLTPEETALFKICMTVNLRLEQEKILQPFVDDFFSRFVKHN